MVIDNKFEIGQTVYLKTDLEQKPRIVTRLEIRPSDIIYVLNSGLEESYHYDFEINVEKDILIAENQ